MPWIAVGTCLALTSCREEIDEGPTEAEILAELKAEKLKEAGEREQARKASVEKLMETMRREQLAVVSREQAEASVPALEEGRQAEGPAPLNSAKPTSGSERSKAAELAYARANDLADRRDQLKKMRGTIINLKAKRQAMEEHISDHSVKLKEAELAAEIARHGDPASRIRLAGSDTRKTAAADAVVSKIKAQIRKLQQSCDGFSDAIAEQKAAINSL